MLWKQWWKLVCELRSACARTRTFLWMVVCLAGMTTRKDLMGVTSIVRALGLVPVCYDRLLDFFHSPALDLKQAHPPMVRSGIPGPPRHCRRLKTYASRTMSRSSLT